MSGLCEGTTGLMLGQGFYYGRGLSTFGGLNFQVVLNTTAGLTSALYSGNNLAVTLNGVASLVADLTVTSIPNLSLVTRSGFNLLDRAGNYILSRV